MDKLQLIPLEEFLATAPAELRTPEATGTPHALQMSRLEHELVLRKKCVRSGVPCPRARDTCFRTCACDFREHTHTHSRECVLCA